MGKSDTEAVKRPSNPLAAWYSKFFYRNKQEQQFFSFIYRRLDIRISSQRGSAGLNWFQLAITGIAILFGMLANVNMVIFEGKLTSAADVLRFITRLVSSIVLFAPLLADMVNSSYVIRMASYYISVVGFTLSMSVLFWLIQYDKGVDGVAPYPISLGFFCPFVILQAWLLPVTHLVILCAIVIVIQLPPAIITIIAGTHPVSVLIELALYGVIVLMVLQLSSGTIASLRQTYRDVSAAHETVLRTVKERDIITGHLKAVLPPHILPRLEAGEQGVTEMFRTAAVVFVHVLLDQSSSQRDRGTGQWMGANEPVNTPDDDAVCGACPVTGLSPAATINALNECFHILDEHASRHGIDRIKTIGPKMMLFVPNIDIPGTLDTLQTFLQDIAEPFDFMPRNVELKLGCAIGPVSGGVIGKMRFQYDIWGNTVNVAARMEALAEPGTLVLTDTPESRILASRTGDTPDVPSNSTTPPHMESVNVKGVGVMQPLVVDLHHDTAETDVEVTLTFDFVPEITIENMTILEDETAIDSDADSGGGLAVGLSRPPSPNPRPRPLMNYGSTGDQTLPYPTPPYPTLGVLPRRDSVYEDWMGRTSTDMDCESDMDTPSESVPTDITGGQLRGAPFMRMALHTVQSGTLNTIRVREIERRFTPTLVWGRFRDENDQQEFRVYTCRRTGRMSVLPLVVCATMASLIDVLFFLKGSARVCTRLISLVLIAASGALLGPIFTAIFFISGTRHFKIAQILAQAGVTVFFLRFIITVAVFWAMHEPPDLILSFCHHGARLMFMWPCCVAFLTFCRMIPHSIVMMLGYVLFAALVYFASDRTVILPFIVELLEIAIIIMMTSKTRSIRTVMTFSVANKERFVKQEVQHLRDKRRDLLQLLYPDIICQAIINGDHIEPMMFNEVALMQFDIVGFTTMSAAMSSAETIEMLNWLYNMCDLEVLKMKKYRVNKIKTIGDAYLVSCGAPEPTPNPVGPLIRLATRLISKLNSGDVPDRYKGINCRFGIAYGTAIGAVMGYDQNSIYDLFGPVVDSVEVMEQGSQPNKLLVSPDAVRAWKAADRVEVGRYRVTDGSLGYLVKARAGRGNHL